MENYLTSDLHLNHENIMNFCRVGFKSLEEMNDAIATSWNKTAKPEDRIYNLGDLAFQTSLKRVEANAILERLNGEHLLIKGNHDEEKKIKFFPKIVQFHREMIVKFGGIDFLLSHYPYKENMTEKDKATRPECFTPVHYNEDGSIMPLLHGHTHEAYTIRPHQLCMCWDRWHRLVSEKEVVEIYNDTKGFMENLDKYNV